MINGFLGIMLFIICVFWFEVMKKKLKKQAQVQENTEITFMSAWFVIGVFLVSLIIYSM